MLVKIIFYYDKENNLDDVKLMYFLHHYSAIHYPSDFVLLPVL